MIKIQDMQETFDYAVDKIVDQGYPSMDKFGSNCMYRGEHGRRCAVGWLIPDEYYRPDTEGLGSYASSVFVEKFLRNCADLADVYELELKR